MGDSCRSVKTCVNIDFDYAFGDDNVQKLGKGASVWRGQLPNRGIVSMRTSCR